MLLHAPRRRAAALSCLFALTALPCPDLAAVPTVGAPAKFSSGRWQRKCTRGSSRHRLVSLSCRDPAPHSHGNILITQRGRQLNGAAAADRFKSLEDRLGKAEAAQLERDEEVRGRFGAIEQSLAAILARLPPPPGPS